MHTQTPSLFLTSTTLLSLLTTTTHAQPSDPFYDSIPFPKPKSSQQVSIQSFTSSSPSCNIPTYPKTYELIDETGPGCHYKDYLPDVFETSTDQTTGISQCQDFCDADAKCIAFAWSLDASTPDVGTCGLDWDFVDESRVQCSPNDTQYMYLAVYNASNWSPPDPAIANGGFEDSCLDQWLFTDFTSDESMRFEIASCSGDECAPNGGAQYAKITGNGENGSTRDRIDAYIGQQPVLLEGAMYRVSADVKGDAGEFRFTYPAHKSVVIHAQANGEWQSVEGELEGRVSHCSNLTGS